MNVAAYIERMQGVALIQAGERARGLRSLELAIEMGKRQKRGPLLLHDYESALAQAKADAHRADVDTEVRLMMHGKSVVLHLLR